MEHLRDSVRLRAYAQKDPLVEYKNEGHQMFQRLMSTIQENFVTTIYKVGIVQPPVQAPPVFRQPVFKSPSASGTATPNKKNIGRNDPCWCGSGKKFKKCHGK